MNEAVGTYLKAFDALRRGGEARRAAVRGCTLELLVLVSEQVLELGRQVDERKRVMAAKAEAIERHKARAREHLGLAITLREQARRLLGTIARGDEAIVAEIGRIAGQASDARSTSVSLASLAAYGRAVVANENPKVIMRARLLGLDTAYVSELEGFAQQLLDDEAELDGLASIETGDKEMQLQAGVTLHFLEMVVDAFEAARGLDGDVPLLKAPRREQIVRRTAEPAPDRLVVTRPR